MSAQKLNFHRRLTVKIHRKHSDNNDEPAIFSDLAFLLMIFFIVLAGFAAKYTLHLNLPVSSKESVAVPPPIVEINLPGNNTIIYNQETLPLDSLSSFFTDKNFSPKTVIKLQVASTCPYQQAVTFLDCAGNAGMTSVNIELMDNAK